MLASFKYAINGIKDALKSEPNLRFHFFSAIIVFVFATFLKFSNFELAILVLTIFFVIGLELVNTTIEKIVDLHSKEKSEEARAIKDISAAVVLLGAISSLIIGGILFLPKLL